MKILFIVPYPTEGASNRYRVEQYLPYLKDNGFEYCVSPFVSSEFYKIIYKKGHVFKKLYYFLKGLMRRMSDIMCVRCYDLIFIHREACPVGPPIFEWLIYKFKKPIIFDFDDAIFLPSFNFENRLYRFLKFPSKTKSIIKMSSHIIIANRFLEDYVRKFNSCVDVIHTPIDTERFTVAIKRNSSQITIGWIGSPTTSSYLESIYHAMQKLSRKYGFTLKIVGAGRLVSIAGVKVENYDWFLEREIQDFQSVDIGIYPLPDTLWVRGKAAFKAIQYMAVGVPAVASPVGMTKDLIQDGANGFLANSEEEWVKKISMLIEDPLLRKKMGLAGRRTVEERFSIKINAPKYLRIIRNHGSRARE